MPPTQTQPLSTQTVTTHTQRKRRSTSFRLRSTRLCLSSSLPLFLSLTHSLLHVGTCLAAVEVYSCHMFFICIRVFFFSSFFYPCVLNFTCYFFQTWLLMIFAFLFLVFFIHVVHIVSVKKKKSESLAKPPESSSILPFSFLQKSSTFTFSQCLNIIYRHPSEVLVNAFSWVECLRIGCSLFLNLQHYYKRSIISNVYMYFCLFLLFPIHSNTVVIFLQLKKIYTGNHFLKKSS